MSTSYKTVADLQCSNQWLANRQKLPRSVWI